MADTTLASCQNTARSHSFFFCWVDYALVSSTFSLSKCDFSHLFHTERSWHTYRFTVVFVSGQQDLPSDARVFSLTFFENYVKLFIAAEKGSYFSPKCLLDLNN